MFILLGRLILVPISLKFPTWSVSWSISWYSYWLTRSINITRLGTFVSFGILHKIILWIRIFSTCHLFWFWWCRRCEVFTRCFVCGWRRWWWTNSGDLYVNLDVTNSTTMVGWSFKLLKRYKPCLKSYYNHYGHPRVLRSDQPSTPAPRPCYTYLNLTNQVSQ